MDGRAYDALKRAGIVIGDYQNVFCSGVGETEIDSNGNGIHYYQTSAWSDLYNASILNAKLGTWYFPISDNEIFIIAFESHMETKADPTYANVRFILDNIESGDATYSKNKALSNDANIYSYAKFVSEQNGVYKFTVDAVVFSGEKKTFIVTVDRVNETCVME